MRISDCGFRRAEGRRQKAEGSHSESSSSCLPAALCLLPSLLSSLIPHPLDKFHYFVFFEHRRRLLGVLEDARDALFGGFEAAQFRLPTVFPGVQYIWGIFPYLAPLLTLPFIARRLNFRRSGAPAALGRPYFREERG